MLMMEAEGPDWPHGGVQGDPLGVVQFLVQEGDTDLAVLVTNKDPVVHIVHKVEVSSEPVDRHLLHIWTEKQGGRWNEKRRAKESVFNVTQFEKAEKWCCWLIVERFDSLLHNGDEQLFQQLSQC